MHNLASRRELARRDIFAAPTQSVREEWLRRALSVVVSSLTSGAGKVVTWKYGDGTSGHATLY